jgi:mannose/fructose-specific phosphotransferase system component IIA
MNEEPQLIDILAGLALPAVIQAFRGEDCESAAETAYEYAYEMLKAREKYLNT